MKILVIRHGVAEELDGGTDAQRELTKQGRKRMASAAKGIASLVPHVDLLASSPLIRAAQTAEIVSDALGGELRPVQIAPLSPRKPVPALLTWLQQQPADSTVALVGHEPHLGTFVSWMMTGLQEPFVVFKKGGACLLEIDGELRSGRAKMLWLLKPSHLRKLR
jgi:phosphohistidine phosphatase